MMYALLFVVDLATMYVLGLVTAALLWDRRTAADVAAINRAIHELEDAQRQLDALRRDIA